MHVHSSSEETDLDLCASPLLYPDPEPFVPLRTLSLSGDRKFKVATETTHGVSSCGTLNLSAAQSIGEFSQSWDRCLSEPLMCFDTTTPPKAPPHPPVIRQSSCDNAVTDNKTNQSQSPLGHSRRAGKGRYAFWKSPQFPARFRHPAQQLASMSSLSSTTTSSLSSLDSFEYIPSPSADKPRPFLFGTSARLRPLTPEIPRKLWSMAFPYDELKDGNENRLRNKEKEVRVKVSVMNCEDKSKKKDERKEEEERQNKAERSEVMEEGDGEAAVEEHKPHDEGISSHIPLPDHEDRGLGLVHTLSHTHTCPVHTNQFHTLHSHTLTLPSKQDKTSRTKITLFPSMGRRMFRQSARVTMATGAKDVTMAQVNVPQTQFYNQNINLLLQSEERRYKRSDANDVCTRKNVCVSRGDASRELSIDTLQKDFCLSDKDTDFQSRADVSQTVSNISSREYFNQSADSVRQIEPRVSISASASTCQKICDSTTISTSGTGYDTESTHVSQSASSSINHDFSSSIVDHISDIKSVSYSASRNISPTTTKVCHGVSVNKITHNFSISPGNANQHANTSTKTSIRQSIRIRLPATVRNSVRAYFSPSHAHTGTQTQADTHTPMLPKSQNRKLFTSKLQ